MTPAEKTRMLAERVMKWEIYKEVPEAWLAYDDQGNLVRTFATFEPLTNLSHAGEVLEAMRAKGWDYVASTCPTSKRHWVEFIPPHHAKENHGKLYSYANKLSTAICHAALLAEGVKEEEL